MYNWRQVLSEVGIVMTKEILKKEYEAIIKDIPKLKSLSDDSLFSLLCYKYFYNEGKLDLSDYEMNFIDGKGDGGIDFVADYETDDGMTSLVLAQCKNRDTISTDDVITAFLKIGETLLDFQQVTTSSKYSDKLREVLRNKLELYSDETPGYSLSLFVASSISKTAKDNWNARLGKQEVLDGYSFEIFDLDDIIDRIASVKMPKTRVDEDEIKIDKSDGVIRYSASNDGENTGLLVNVKATSIKALFEKYQNKGLFGENFRQFVKDRKIDDAIERSLKEKRNRFWFLNNGIIIGCSDFREDGNTIKLYDFSIINGCQTTTLIAEKDTSSKAGQEFVIPCKIVKPPKGVNPDDFISEIAEASNSQKPISPRDLKANAKEQKLLKLRLEENRPPIYLEIKRGGKRKKKPITDKWQEIRNDALGQLILSFYMQMPGTARSNKKKIFAEEQTYRKIFRPAVERDSTSIADLLKLNYCYTQYQRNSLQNDPNSIIRKNVLNYGYCHVIAIIGFMLKIKRGQVILKDFEKKDKFVESIMEDSLRGPIYSSNLPDDYVNIQESLFATIVNLMVSAYEKVQVQEGSLPNFLKTDAKYFDKILGTVITDIYTVNEQRKRIESYLEIFK